jgi:hypothetical protein
MKAADIFPSKWLSASDLGDAEPTVVIDRVVLEDISQTDRKPVIYFRGKTKGMVCNKTNWKRIEYILKSDDSDNWPGQAIKLYVELVDMQGQMKPALRVKAPDRREPARPVQNQPTQAQRVMTKRDGYELATGNKHPNAPTDDGDGDLPRDEIPF